MVCGVRRLIKMIAAPLVACGVRALLSLKTFDANSIAVHTVVFVSLFFLIVVQKRIHVSMAMTMTFIYELYLRRRAMSAIEPSITAVLLPAKHEQDKRKMSERERASSDYKPKKNV